MNLNVKKDCISFNWKFPTNIKIRTEFVTSHLGLPRKACWDKFSIAIYGKVAYVKTAATLHTREIPSCLDTNPELKHRLFQQWLFQLHVTFFAELLGEHVLCASNGVW